MRERPDPARRTMLSIMLASVGLGLLRPRFVYGGIGMTAELNFEALRYTRGEAYKTLRNDFLPLSAELRAVIDAASGDTHWERRATAAILRGWSEHAQLYRKIRQDLSSVDPRLQARTVTGLSGIAETFDVNAERVWGPAVVPLGIEAVMKFDETEPAWRLNAYIAMLAGAPDPLSLEPVIALLFRTNDSSVRRQCAMTLARLPADIVAPRLEELKARSKAIAEALEYASSELE